MLFENLRKNVFLVGKYFCEVLFGEKSGFLLSGFSRRSWKSLQNHGVQNRIGPAQTCPELEFPPTEMAFATTNGALQEAAPGRPELRCEPNQNGRKAAAATSIAKW